MLVYEVSGNYYKDTLKNVMMRSFVAIEISNTEIISSIKKFQYNIKIDAKPVESNNFHFTLQFLGEITEEISEKIVKALNSIEFTSFSVNLNGVGVFPKPEFPKVIWIGTDKNGGDMLIELSRRVEIALKPLGFSSDKPFKPHITIFRIKKKIGGITNKLKDQKMTDFGVQEIVKIKLKKSELTSKGPIYSDLAEINVK